MYPDTNSAQKITQKTLAACFRYENVHTNTGVMMNLERISVEKNLKNRVYEIIRNYVVRPDTPPGMRLYEERFSKEIGVSRTPVKMALNRLEHDGLVTIIPNKGAFKVHLSWQEVTEIIKIRESLETLSLEMVKEFNEDICVERFVNLTPDVDSFQNPDEVARYPDLDKKFHEELLLLAKTKILFRLTKNFDNLFHLLRLVAIPDIERIRLSIEEHKKIVEALRLRDIPLAISYTRENYESALRNLEAKNKILPGLFR